MLTVITTDFLANRIWSSYLQIIIFKSSYLHCHFHVGKKATYGCGPNNDATEFAAANKTGAGACTNATTDTPRKCYCAIDTTDTNKTCDPLPAAAASTESGASIMSDAATVLVSIAMLITYRMF